MNYYKITNRGEKHNYMEYKDGLNIDCEKFNPSGDCTGGGIYFSREDILAFLEYGPWIRKVNLPEGTKIYENPGTPKKWKANMVILKKRRKIDLKVIEELVKEGANIHVSNEYPLRWASEKGHLEIVEFLVKEGANIHVSNEYPLRWASENGHLKIVEFLVKEGANIHVNDECPLRWASEKGHLEIVEFLVKEGANI